MKKVLAGIGIIIALTVFALFFARDASAPSTQNSPIPIDQTISTPGFNKQLHSIDKADSIWWMVNKVRPISPIDYAPTDLTIPKIPLRIRGGGAEMRLRSEAARSLESMHSEASKANINFMLVSGYRSYQTQVSVYNGWVQRYGQAGADKISARPGTSEHQTGLGADLGVINRKCELEVCFAELPEGKWIANNAYIYGFVVRYPENKLEATGYDYEPWHIRYVGKELAAEMHKENIPTLEEFFGIVPDKQPY